MAASYTVFSQDCPVWSDTPVLVLHGKIFFPGLVLIKQAQEHYTRLWNVCNHSQQGERWTQTEAQDLSFRQARFGDVQVVSVAVSFAHKAKTKPEER